MARSQRRQPVLRESNPGQGVEARIAISCGRGAETVNVVELLQRVLADNGLAFERHDTWIELPELGFAVVPQIAGVEALPDGGMHTVTTIQVNHPTLTPEGVFEYQHACGDTVAESMARGFAQWFQGDLVVFQEALLPMPQVCMTMEMSFPEKEGKPACCRRAVLGPVMHLRASPAAGSEEHPFCQCCFVTNTFEAYRGLIEGDGFYAIRFFASRGEDGTPEADCRVNGDDWPAGVEALRNYVRTWPGSGFEFRKQTVLLQTIGKPASAEA